MLSDHPNPVALVAFTRGELPPHETVQVALHLAACTACRNRTDRPEAEAPASVADFGAAFERAAASAQTTAHRLAGEAPTPQGMLPGLLALSREDQRAAIRSTAALCTVRFTRQLLDTCRKTWSYDPRRAEHLAWLALRVTDHLPSRLHGQLPLRDLRAEAWGTVGNCLRIRGELGDASIALDRASALLGEGTRAVEESLPLASLRASLLRDLGDARAAFSTLEEAVDGSRSIGDRHLEGRLLVGQAMVLTSDERSDAAIPLLERARRLVDREREDHIAAAVQQNLSLALERVGEADRALDALERAEELFPRRRLHFERLRCGWARAQILASHGRPVEAARLLGRISRGFDASGLSHDAALAALDQAEVILTMGRHKTVQALTSRALGVFAQRQIEHGVLRALDLFRRAGGSA